MRRLSTAKAELREKLIAQRLHWKIEESQISNLNFHWQNQGNQSKPKASRRKETIAIFLLLKKN